MFLAFIKRWWTNRIIRRARQAFEDQRWSEAADLAQEALEGNPGNVDAKMLLGTALFNAERYTEAAACFEEVTEADPSNKEARGNLALAAARARKAEQATPPAEAFATGAEANAQRTTADMIKQGDWPALKAAAREAAERSPNDANILLQLGMAHYRMGEAQQALEIYDRLLKLVTKEADAAVVDFNRATVLMQLNRWEEACDVLAGLADMPAENRGKLQEESILYNLGYCYRQRKMIKMARSTYERLSFLNPSYKDVEECIDRLRVPLAASLPEETSGTTCGTCGKSLPLGASYCSACGWSAAVEEPVGALKV